jgi:hypothetical protein
MAGIIPQRYNMENQKHNPNPSVNRQNRKAILEKRVRNLMHRVKLSIKLQKKLADYKAELGIK